MRDIARGHDKACQEIAEALGFDPKRILGIVLNMKAGDAVTAIVELYVERVEMQEISRIVGVNLATPFTATPNPAHTPAAR